MLLETTLKEKQTYRTITQGEYYRDNKIKIWTLTGAVEFLSPGVDEIITLWDGPRMICQLVGQKSDTLSDDDLIQIYEAETLEKALYKKSGEWIEYKAFREWKATRFLDANSDTP